MNQRQKILMMITGILMGLLLLVLVFGDNGLLELKERRRTLEGLRRANNELIQTNVRLKRSIDRLQHDDEFVEALARRELGMVRPDEVVFQFKDRNTGSTP